MLIKIGTRGSKLALWQAQYVADALKKEGSETEIVVIETKGDKILNKSLAKIGSKGVFTAELEEQLIKKKIDIAVHSAKDMQSVLAKDLEIIAFSEREKANDVLISFNKRTRLDNFDKSFVIGTSSTRRIAMLRYYHPHIRIAEARGNLQTRMKKLDEGYYDALILAYAGVKRMNLEDYIVETLELEKFIPPVGQGTIAIEASKKLDNQKQELIRRAVNHTDTEYCLLAERAYLKTLEGGCSIPSFGLATLKQNQIILEAGIIGLEGTPFLKDNYEDKKENAAEIGVTLAHKILEAGGDKVLKDIRKQLKM